MCWVDCMSHWVALMSSSPFEIWLLGSIQKGAPNPKTKQINWFYLLLLFPPFTFFPSQENIPSFNAQFCPSTPPFSLWPTCLARSSMVGLDPNSKENKSESPSHPIPPPPPQSINLVQQLYPSFAGNWSILLRWVKKEWELWTRRPQTIEHNDCFQHDRSIYVSRETIS